MAHGCAHRPTIPHGGRCTPAVVARSLQKPECWDGSVAKDPLRARSALSDALCFQKGCTCRFLTPMEVAYIRETSDRLCFQQATGYEYSHSVRREGLDHLLILREQQLARVLLAYVAYFNRARPHQGLQQQIPDPPAPALLGEARDGPLLALPVVGGLPHEYCRVA
jgi:hypothetical protein